MATSADRVRVRHGAKSCVECRRRKIRCTWPKNKNKNGNGAPSDELSACDRCISRGLTCIPQLVRPPSQQRLPAAQSLADDRLRHLERELSSLTALLRERQHVPSLDTGHVAEVAKSSNDDTSEHANSGDVEDSRPPYHLRLLFEEFGMYSADPENGHAPMPPNTKFKQFVSAARERMQSLLPSREEIEQLVGFAPTWMALYHTLFPTFFTLRAGQQLVTDYDRMHDPDVDPIMLAMYILSVAITVQQICPDLVTSTFFHGQGVASFVAVVCQVVGQTVIANDALIGTVQGIETAMLYFRLLLGRGDLKRTWMMLRRIIALAEMIGLPQAQYDTARKNGPRSQPQQIAVHMETMELRATVWETLCATDRNFSMMMNLPASTSRYAFPRDKSVMRGDRVSAQAYNYQLSAICAIVVEIDELYMHGVAESEAYEKVLGADHKLRTLAASVPRTWWQVREGGPLADLLVKFWHNYITARVHLRPAMMNNSDGQYAYSRTTCWDVCQDAVRRFIKFRPVIPSGFFVCRVLDVQAFTAASFLLLSSKSYATTSLQSSLWRNAPSTEQSQVVDLVHQLRDCFRLVRNKAGSEFAREAITALETLETHVQGNNFSQSLLLKIPLLGKVSINGVSNDIVNTSSATSREEGEFGGTRDSETYQSENLGLQSSFAGPSTSSSAHMAPLSWMIEFGDTADMGTFPVESFNLINTYGSEGGGGFETLNNWF